MASSASSLRPAHPESAYLKAFLIRIQEGTIYTAQLHRFLVRHPLLVIEPGFRLVLDPNAPYGFDVEGILPCEVWFRQKPRQFDQGILQALLQSSVRSLQDEIPGLGETVVGYVYETAVRHGGIAAVPLNQHSHKPFGRLSDGTPRCPIACPCIRPSSSLIPTAIGLNASSAPCSFLRGREFAVLMNNLPKAKAASKT